MMIRRFGLILTCLLILVSCGKPMSSGNLEKVGMLVPDTINDQVWGTKGYKGLLKIQSTFNVDVFYKEGMNSEEVVVNAVNELKEKGVNLIFGHGSQYSTYFNKISSNYPDIHFVSFNGDARKKNTTSLNFEAFAMGYFGGMVAAYMSKTDKVGIIAAFEWQPEVEGFYEGVKFQNPDAIVDIDYVGSWNDSEKAIKLLDEMIAQDVDVVYPTGDGYNVPVIEKLKENGLYAIGFISDQADLGESTVLTSTVQHVGDLYEIVANKYNEEQLASGNLYFDFQDEVISLGKFSPLIDNEFKNQLKQYIETYKETGELPSY